MKIAAVSLALALALVTGSALAAEPPAIPAHVATLKAAMEKLWIGHIDAVRKVDVAEVAGDATATMAAEGQVVTNAHAIAAAVAGFYGKAAGDQLFTLLVGHYGAIKAYLDAAVKNDVAGESQATSKLTDNAGQLAAFLAGANPYLPKDALTGMLMTHGSQHIEQIQELTAKKSDAKTAEAMRAHIVMVADALADAIAKQFPAKI